MRLSILASGSSGNCYVLQNDREALIIECGVSLSSVLRCLDYNTIKVKGCLLSHCHTDHSKYVESYLERFAVYTSKGTIDSLNFKQKRRPQVVMPLVKFNIGGFDIVPFPTQHDCKEPFGFLIGHPDFGVLLFATDTYYIQYRFKGVNHYMVECNYSKQLINENVNEGIIPVSMLNRVIKSHLSLETLLSTLDANDLSSAVGIILIHISENSGSKPLFAKEIGNHTGIRTFSASAGMEFDIDKEIIFIRNEKNRD